MLLLVGSVWYPPPPFPPHTHKHIPISFIYWGVFQRDSSISVTFTQVPSFLTTVLMRGGGGIRGGGSGGGGGSGSGVAV